MKKIATVTLMLALLLVPMSAYISAQTPYSKDINISFLLDEHNKLVSNLENEQLPSEHEDDTNLPSLLEKYDRLISDLENTLPNKSSKLTVQHTHESVEAELCMICHMGEFVSEGRLKSNVVIDGYHYLYMTDYYQCTYTNHMISAGAIFCCTNPNHKVY